MFTTFKGSLENVTIVVEYIENASDVYGCCVSFNLANHATKSYNIFFINWAIKFYINIIYISI